MKIQFVDIKNADLQMLVGELDKWFQERYGVAYQAYAEHNRLDAVAGAVIAYIDEIPVGCGCWKSFDAVSAELKRIYVRQAYRRSGVAAKLVNTLEQNAAAIGAHRMILATGCDMQHAVAFYETQGYHKIHGFGSYQQDTAVQCMEKSISDGTMR